MPWEKAGSYPEREYRENAADSLFARYVPEEFLAEYAAAASPKMRYALETRFLEVVRWQDKNRYGDIHPEETVLHHVQGLLNNVTLLESDKNCKEVLHFLAAQGVTPHVLRWVFLLHDIGETKGGVGDVTTSDQMRKAEGELAAIHREEEGWALKSIATVFTGPRVEEFKHLYSRFHNRKEHPSDVLGHLARVLDVMHGVQHGAAVVYPERGRRARESMRTGTSVHLSEIEQLGHGDSLTADYYIDLFKNLGAAFRLQNAPSGVYTELRTFLRKHLIGAFRRGYVNPDDPTKNKTLTALVDSIEAGLLRHVSSEGPTA